MRELTQGMTCSSRETGVSKLMFNKTSSTTCLYDDYCISEKPSEKKMKLKGA